MVLIIVFEEGCEILRGKDEIGLKTNSMHGVERNRALRDSRDRGWGND